MKKPLLSYNNNNNIHLYIPVLNTVIISLKITYINVVYLKLNVYNVLV